MVTGKSPTATEVEAWIVGRLASDFGLDSRSIDPGAPFERLGLTSREVVMLSGDTEDWLGLSLSPVLLYEHPSIRALSEHLATVMGGGHRVQVDTGPAAATQNRPADERIAIIGMAGRFPGANDVDAFWQALVEGKDCIGPAPAGRWNTQELAESLAGKKPLSNWGGFLDRVDEFDAGFFGISGREATHIDPQQRLLLEVTWEALADAGLPVGELSGQAVGVYVGISSSEYGQAQLNRIDQINSYVGTGSALSIAANRLSYFFDWRGPSVAVDTACSASLVGVHLACQSLRRGETSLAVAAGANLILSPAVTVNFNEAGAMAADGNCKAFDARADGYVRSEGVAAVILKPLSQARSDGDRVYAVILGSAVNQDGRTNGLMAPNPRAQEEVILAACRDAAISPAEISYVEAHGTGTLLGDPIEAKALAAVRQPSADQAAVRPLRIGSVKTNIGHLEAAAGVAGLIKTALAAYHRQLPASLHFETPNPHIPFAELPLRVQERLEPWPQAGERAIAGVSSFGFGGTNAHIVLASMDEVEAANGASEPGEASATTGAEAPATDAAQQLLVLSARTPEALAAKAERWRTWLSSQEDFESICYTAGRRQSHLEQRLALVADTAGEAVELLQAYLAGEADPRLEAGSVVAPHADKVVFVCPGQGSQWHGMARGLIDSQPVFRRSLEETGGALRAFVDWDLLEVLLAGEAPERIDVIQPVLFAVSVALADLWRDLGVTPAAVVGHSMGEVAAAHIAGVLSLDDACRVICGRSRLLREIGGQGLMAVADMTAAEAEKWLGGRDGTVAIAAVNGPRSIVLSGDRQAVEAALADLEARGVYCRRVKVDVASHSSQVDGLRPLLLEVLGPIRPTQAQLPIFSTVTGEPLSGPEMDAAYWADNLRQPVLFAKAVARLLEKGYAAFIELSPHPVLLPAIGQMQSPTGDNPLLVASMRRDSAEWPAFLASLGRLYVHGYSVDWSRLFRRAYPLVSLPRYPWQRERHWFEPGPVGKDATLRIATRGGHPLLGGHIALATGDRTHVWQNQLSLATLPFLGDHRVNGQVLFPAAGWLEMALSAAGEYAGGQPVALEGITFDETLPLPQAAAVTLQLVLASEGHGQASFQAAARAGDGHEWVQHARGLLRLQPPEEEEIPALRPSELQTRLARVEPIDAFYADMESRGLQYGPGFRSVAAAWRGEGEALARLDTKAGSDVYLVNPAMLDGAFQTLAAAMPESLRKSIAGRLTLPVAVGRLRVLARPQADAPVWCYARLDGRPDEHGTGSSPLQGDVFLLDHDGSVLVSVRGLQLRVAGEAALSPEERAIRQWFFQTALVEMPLEAQRGAPVTGKWLLFAHPDAWQDAVADQLAAAGRECIVVSLGSSLARTGRASFELAPGDAGQFRQLLKELEAAGQPLAGAIFGWALGAQEEELPGAAIQSAVGAMHLAQALAGAGWREPPRLYMLAGDLPASPLIGLARTVNHEHPELRCTIVAVDPANLPPPASVAVECLANSVENYVILAGEQRLAPRLQAHTPAAPPAGPQPPAAHDGGAYRLHIRQPGVPDSLYLAPMQRRPPAAGEVEIAVEAAGLNFLDVLAALGTRPDQPAGLAPLGFECAGRVTAVGDGVERLKAGDRVMAMAPGAMATFAYARASLAAPVPESLSSEAAATIPIAFLTAWYALRHIGRLQPGERVLIHSAASGTGLAAVQVAQWLGADIYATAGSSERRALLQSLGVRHVMDSRTLAFVDDVMAATGGQGVDVVLNSLAGDAIAASLSLLRGRGRFLELGKRDIYAHRKVGLYAFRRNLSMSVIDLAGLASEDPEFVGRLLSELLPMFADGTLRPLPAESYPLSQASVAFRRMAQARHHGKLVLMPAASPDSTVAVPRSQGPVPTGIRPDGTYLVTGGFGAIGRQVAAYLVEHGARHVVLLGRRAPDAEVLASIAAWEAAGARVHAFRADVASLSDMQAVFERFAPTRRQIATNGTDQDGLPPLLGIFHAAGVLDDGVLLQQSAQRFEAVMAPKVIGSWNLHRLSLDHPVELFVPFSSAAALVGSPGQSNYAAANAFMDRLAHFRHERGLPAVSIQWGPWADIGLAAQHDRSGRLSNRGFDAIQPAQGLRALDWALRERGPVLSIMPFDARQWRQSYPQAAGLPLLSSLASEAPGDTPGASDGLRETLLAARSAQARYAGLERHIRREIAEVLRIPISRISPTTPLDSLGFDSLLALELRNRLELSLSIRLPATLIWNYPSLPAMVAYVASLAGLDVQGSRQAIKAELEAPAQAQPVEPDSEQSILDEVGMLSDDAALRELVGEEDSIGE
jgi:acyl transferase domain-containing protein/NADPH-dependent curcumin reductase CurA/NAD(P)-dependent dehydrogenase (short-subunit alcohol dehydrogenase family)/acyl carrier protein